MDRQTKDMHGKPLWNKHHGECPRCGSIDRQFVAPVRYKDWERPAFVWKTYRCEDCGLKYDE